MEDYIVEIERETGNIIKVGMLDLSYQWKIAKAKTGLFMIGFIITLFGMIKTNSIILSGRHQDAVISIDYDTNNLNWIIGDNTNWSEEMQKYFFTPKTTPLIGNGVNMQQWFFQMVTYLF